MALQRNTAAHLCRPYTYTLIPTYTCTPCLPDPSHSNYYFWWNPFNSLFTNNAQYHDYHHLLRGFRYNYAQPYFTFWDDIMGTKHMATIEELNRTTGKDAIKQEVMPEVADAAAAVEAKKSN